MPDTKQLQVDRDELIAFDVALYPTEINHQQDLMSEYEPTKELMRKVGYALLEVAESGSSTKLMLSENECWMLRERLDIRSSTSTRPKLGFELKCKLYETLLTFETDRGVAEIAQGLPDKDKEERLASDVKTMLADGKWQRGKRKWRK